MNCSYSVEGNSALKSLKRHFGSNIAKFIEHYELVMKNGEFSSEFNAWCQDHYGKTIDPDAAKGAEGSKMIRKYYNAKHRDVHATTNIQSDSIIVGRFGYSSSNARQEGMRRVVEIMNTIYHQLTHEMQSSPDYNKFEFYADYSTKQVEDYIIERYVQLATPSNEDPSIYEDRILKALNNNDIAAVEELFKDIKSSKEDNLLALYKEMISDRENYFTTIFKSQKLGDIRISDKDLQRAEDTDQALAADEANAEDSSNEDSETNNENVEKDTMLYQLDNKSGFYSSYMKHIGIGIKSYLNSVKRLNSTHVEGVGQDAIYDLDTDNELGLPSCHTAEELSNIILGYCDFTNVNTMINSMKEKAKALHGYAALVAIADTLSNDMNFAYEFYQTYAKIAISKAETVVTDSGMECRISNRNCNPKTALRFEYLSGINNTSIIIRDEDALLEMNEISEDIAELHKDVRKFNDSDKENVVIAQNKIIDKLTKALKAYYPTIDVYSISNFVANANGGDFFANVKSLNTLLQKTIESSAENQKLYSDIQAKVADARRHNAEIRRKKMNNEPVKEDMIDETEFYNESHISTSSRSTAIELADILLPYSVVKLEFNSRNVHGNQSSDIMNNSMITNLVNTLRSPEALKNLGKYKFQSRQYDFSNIMVEHKDEKGNVINHGLFREQIVNGEKSYVPTEYAEELLRHSLFNGATEASTRNSVLYSEMSRGDYTATAFINFKKVDTSLNSNHGIDYGNYFMRIPSDAPKNFIVTAPRYKVDANNQLFSISNQAELSKMVDEYLKSIPTINNGDFKDDYSTRTVYKRNLDAVVKDLTTQQAEKIRLYGKTPLSAVKDETGNFGFKLKYEEGKEVFITCSSVADPSNFEDTYVMRGKLYKDDYGYYISDAKLVGRVKADDSDKGQPLNTTELYNAIKETVKNDAIKDGRLTLKLNTNHTIYKQFKGVFTQELLNMASTIRTFFQTSTDNPGMIKLDNGEVQFNSGFDNSKKCANSLYAIYHVGKGKTILEKGKDGFYKLTGKVFTSDKFTIVNEDATEEEKVVTNYGQRILDRAFNLLYGGANDSYLHTNLAGDQIILTAEQERIIEEEIGNFLQAYIQQSKEKLEEYKDFINMPYNEDDIAEFALNHHLMYINFNDLYEGDTKFYKDSQTFLKRAKEVQASGLPYGITDYHIDYTKGKQEIKSSPLSTTTFGPNNYTVKAYDRFTGVTVINSIKTGETIGEFNLDKKGKPVSFKKKGILAKLMIDTYKAVGMKEDAAEKAAFALLKGYHGTTVNDAQSYITFDEWVRRITARGQLAEYKDLIDAILDESKPINAKQLAKFVQVQKNFYYDMYFDERTKTMVPRQIKNAEFVLVPRFIRGTELEAIHNAMVANGIDQLNTEETSKAGKKNVLTLWSKDGILTQKALNEFNNKCKNASEIFDYNHLYTQQETPQHMDTENKAGIQIMKKILDNIPMTKDNNGNYVHPLAATKEKFFKLYSANIKTSFNKTMEELGVEVGLNGNIKLTDDSVANINADKLCSMFREEAARLGLDSNAMDYFTLEDSAKGSKTLLNTKMPLALSNFSSKAESIAQSLFNNRITRQTLPGFHAAQITNVGWKSFGNTVENRSYSSDLRYHPDGEPYVEIKLPKSVFNFDINKRDDNGNIIGTKTDKDLLDEINEAEVNKLIGYRIPTEGKQSICIMKIVGFTDEALGSTIVVPDDWVSQTGSDFDIDSVYAINFSTYINSKGNIKKINYREIYEIKDWYNDLNREIRNKIYSTEDTVLRDKLIKLEDSVNTILKVKSYDENYNAISNLAKELGIEIDSFSDIQNRFNNNVEMANSKQGRNNEILQCMLNILGHSTSLEENLSRSNFEKIIDARDKLMSEITKAKRNARSPYNFFDQAAYQEDVMSGAKLKAFSVTRDTFCSICNTIRPTLHMSKPIKISYYKKDGYTLTELKKSFDNVEEYDDYFVVTHNTLGWSKNDKNVAGMILTAYSSQTTAHILDAVKEGAIPNVNDLTFKVYKTFVDVGSDYETAIGFIMQPAITEIVKAYNKNKSIYSETYNNPIQAAKEVIASKLSKLTDMGSAINPVALDESIKLEPIDNNKLRDRLANPNRETKNDLIFDYQVLLHYENMSNLSSVIGACARVCNPDKFGAKQTIFATNKVMTDISELLEDDEFPIKIDDKKTKTSKHLLSAIYPGAENGLEYFIMDEDEESAYPPLYYFLKYATAPSIKINSTLFETQNPAFVDAVTTIADNFTHGKNLDEQTYNDFKTYIIGSLYNQMDTLTLPYVYDLKKGWQIQINNNRSEEINRVFGFGKAANTDITETVTTVGEDGKETTTINSRPFMVKDIDKITKEEVEAFNTLSPAQKVTWIQSNYANAGVFKYLKTSLFNSGKYSNAIRGSQTIMFADNSENIENIYDEFNMCFFNSDPIIKSATIDLIKYAFLVEGYKMRRQGISKIIPNDCLLSDEIGTNFQDGMSIVSEFKQMINNIDRDSIQSLYEKFLRSRQIKQVVTKFVKKKPKTKNVYELPRVGDLVVLDLNYDANQELAVKYNLCYKNKNGGLEYNSYVRLNFGKNTALYKIDRRYTFSENDNGIDMLYAIPLNNLEATETSDSSINPANNKFPRVEYYTNIIDQYIKMYTEAPTTKLVDVVREAQKNLDEYKVSSPIGNVKQGNISFDINHPSNPNYEGALEHAKNKITKHFDAGNTKPLYMVNNGFSHYIRDGILNPSIQTIDGKRYKIYKYGRNSKIAKQYLAEGKTDAKIDEKKYNPQLQALIENARNNGYKFLNIYVVEPYAGKLVTKTVDTTNNEKEEEEDKSIIRHSSVSESSFEESTEPVETAAAPISISDDVIDFAKQAMLDMHRSRSTGNDIRAAKALKFLNDLDIVRNKAVISQNIDSVIATTAEYVVETAENIINDLNYFMKDENDEYVNIINPLVIKAIKDDETIRNRFVKTFMDAKAFIQKYNTINNLTSEDDNVRRNLEKIQEAIDRLTKLPIINQAEQIYGNEYLAKISNNPLIVNDLLSIFGGYHSTSFFNAWINDLQESANPLIQIVTKEALADIRSKEMQATERVKEFRAKLNEIREKAKRAGLTVDWKNIIDSEGKFIQDYTREFIDKMKELSDEMNQHEKNSIPYLRAKLEYDKWKLNHLNQEVVDDYYQEKIEAEEEMLINYPHVYSKYKQLQSRQADILSHISAGQLDEYWSKQLDEVNAELLNLSSTSVFNQIEGVYYDKKSIDTYGGHPTPEQIINSYESAIGLSRFITAMRDINNKYFRRDAKFGFYEELEKHLKTINRVERKDNNGRITATVEELNSNTEYQRAKTWIAANARFVVRDEIREEIQKAFADLRQGEASISNGDNKVKRNQTLKIKAKSKDAYDEKGIIDGRKFSNEDIEQIKKEQLAIFDIKESSPYSEHGLIRNAPDDTTIFSTAFYTGMTTNGASNPAYLALVKKINNIVSKYYSPAQKRVLTYLMTEEDLTTLDKLYDELDETKHKDKTTNGKKVTKFIEEHVKFTYNNSEYEKQLRLVMDAHTNPETGELDAYGRLWKKTMGRDVEIEKDIIKRMPNRYIFGTAVPKDYDPANPYASKWVDTKKTKALHYIHSHCSFNPTPYYYQKIDEMQELGETSFNAWFEANHIYNPFTKQVEPLPCWTTMQVKEEVRDGVFETSGEWVPSLSASDKVVKDGTENEEDALLGLEPDMRNHDYKADSTNATNFKLNGPQFKTSRIRRKDYSDGVNYANNVSSNEYEKEAKDYLQKLCYDLARTRSARKYLDKGYAPAKAKAEEHNAWFYAKELAKIGGWVDNSTGRQAWKEDGQVNYAEDEAPNMPMMHRITDKTIKEYQPTKPYRYQFEEGEAGDKAFKAAEEKYKEDLKKLEEAQTKLHADLHDDNWDAVFEEFITRAAHYNAVQDNKYMLFYASEMLKKLPVYVKNSGFKNLKRVRNTGVGEDVDYEKAIDSRLQEQYINWLRRLIYDQWKRPNNYLTRAANIMQNLTSAKFMMLNVTGGIANVTVGETQIAAEAFAKEYFAPGEWAKGHREWSKSVPNFIYDMTRSDGKASSVQNAIIKFFNVVDFDELNGVARLDDKNVFRTARDLAFSPQAMGEHMMQNSVLFTMLHSHRLFIDPRRSKNGKEVYTFMNEAEYINRAHDDALEQLLDNDANLKALYTKFKNNETKNADSMKEYAWFQNDIATKFVNIYLNNKPNLKREYGKKIKELKDKYRNEFNSDEHPTLMSQLDLGADGTMKFKDGSILSQIGDRAYDVLGAFKGRVISTNKKIHGVYDKLGAAQIEKYFWGALLMQYHKHIVPGIMKRYRRQGYYNEERGTVEKGMYQSLLTFLKLPLQHREYIDKLKVEGNLTEEDVIAIGGVQNIFKSYFDLITHARLNYNTMTEYDKANIRRALTNACGVLSAICLAIALRCIWDDEDEQGFMFNLMMYEADRLASETAMYNPVGLLAEGKKLWSSPVASINGCVDMLATMGLIGQYIIQGDDFEPEYKTGLYRGENKLKVRLERNVPMLHSYRMLQRLKRSNRYYKLGNDMLGFVNAKGIAEAITGKKQK